MWVKLYSKQAIPIHTSNSSVRTKFATLFVNNVFFCFVFVKWKGYLILICVVLISEYSLPFRSSVYLLWKIPHVLYLCLYLTFFTFKNANQRSLTLYPSYITGIFPRLIYDWILRKFKKLHKSIHLNNQVYQS